MSEHYISHNMFDMLLFLMILCFHLKILHFSVLVILCRTKATALHAQKRCAETIPANVLKIIRSSRWSADIRSAQRCAH